MRLFWTNEPEPTAEDEAALVRLNAIASRSRIAGACPSEAPPPKVGRAKPPQPRPRRTKKAERRR